MLTLLESPSAFVLLIAEWVLCFGGIILHIAGTHLPHFRAVEIVLFLCMGWGGTFIFAQLVSIMDTVGMV